MALGIQELIVPIILLGVIGIFGRKWFLKLYTDFKGIKTDMKKIDEGIKVEEWKKLFWIFKIASIF